MSWCRPNGSDASGRPRIRAPRRRKTSIVPTFIPEARPGYDLPMAENRTDDGRLDDVLARRHESEEAFHDVKYTTHADPVIYEMYPTARIFTRMKERMGDLTGRRVLEYGCGTGWVTVELASMGAVVDSF